MVLYYYKPNKRNKDQSQGDNLYGKFQQGQNQKYRPMEQDRRPRNKPMYLWVPYS